MSAEDHKPAELSFAAAARAMRHEVLPIVVASDQTDADVARSYCHTLIWWLDQCERLAQDRMKQAAKKGSG